MVYRRRQKCCPSFCRNLLGKILTWQESNAPLNPDVSWINQEGKILDVRYDGTAYWIERASDHNHYWVDPTFGTQRAITLKPLEGWVTGTYMILVYTNPANYDYTKHEPVFIVAEDEKYWYGQPYGDIARRLERKVALADLFLDFEHYKNCYFWYNKSQHKIYKSGVRCYPL